MEHAYATSGANARSSCLLTPRQTCALATIAISVALLALSAFALAGIYSPASAFGSFGDHIGDLGAYSMIGAGLLALITLAVIKCCKNKETGKPASVNKNTTAAPSSTVLPAKAGGALASAPSASAKKVASAKADEPPTPVGSVETGGRLAIIDAATKGNTRVLFMIKSDEDRGEALTQAAQNGHFDLVMTLLQDTILPEDLGRAVNYTLAAASDENNLTPYANIVIELLRSGTVPEKQLNAAVLIAVKAALLVQDDAHEVLDDENPRYEEVIMALFQNGPIPDEVRAQARTLAASKPDILAIIETTKPIAKTS